jgi:hypothetical protein
MNFDLGADATPRYHVIYRILCPEKTDWVCGYSSVDMTDVMEFDERDDGDI